MARKKAKQTSAVEQTQKPADELIAKLRQRQEKNKAWMWLGVIGISAIIFCFWAWSFVSNVSLFNWKRSQEKNLIQKTQTEWNQIFAETEKEQSEKKIMREELKNVITEIKNQSVTSTVTTTEITTNTLNTTTVNQ